MRRRTRGLLLDIQDAAEFLRDETRHQTLASYRGNRVLRQAVERNFEIIGEALRRLERDDPATAGRITGVRAIVGFRNVLAHGYDVVDDERVWAAIRERIPQLLRETELLLREAEGR